MEGNTFGSSYLQNGSLVLLQTGCGRPLYYNDPNQDSAASNLRENRDIDREITLTNIEGGSSSSNGTENCVSQSIRLLNLLQESGVPVYI